MISWGETGADVSVACTGPPTFDLANVAIDQTAAVATMTATAAKMIILRISCHPFQRDELMIALPHHPQRQGEELHTSRLFVIRGSYRGRRQHGAVDARAMRFWGSRRRSRRASLEDQRRQALGLVKTAVVASPAATKRSRRLLKHPSSLTTS